MGSHERWLYSQAIVILLKNLLTCVIVAVVTYVLVHFFIDTTIDENEEMAFFRG